MPLSSRIDRMIAKWFVYVVIGLAVAYLLVHCEELRSALHSRITMGRDGNR